jgi:hypothetical protein
MSQQTPIEWIGTLTDLIPAEYFHGTVSPKSRLESGEITAQQIADAKEYQTLCYVPVTEGAGIRCVEDREEQDFDDSNPASYQLGPQVQGATIDIAAAKRLVRGIEDGATLEADIDTEISEHSARFTPSAHTDEAHQADGEMGCGAQKGQETKLGYYQDEHMAGIAGVVRVLHDKAGKVVPAGVLESLPASAAKLSSVSTEYYANKPTAARYIQAQLAGNPESHKVVRGQHNAGMVVLNFDSDWTLSPGKLNMHTDGQVMSFGLDVWYLFEEYPEDEAAGLLADAIATLMNLTDGSLEVGLRLPASTPQSV